MKIQASDLTSNRDQCLAHFRSISLSKKVCLFFESSWNSLLFMIKKIICILKKANTEVEHLTRANREFSKDKLIICLHGLNSAPFRLKPVIDQLQQRPQADQADIFVPYVLEKGNATLDRLADQIEPVIRAWASAHPGGELVLIGTSNGSRIAQAVDARLKHGDLSLRQITSISISGACRGSKTANLAKKVSKCLPKSLLASPVIKEEMPVGSPRNQQLKREWEETVKHPCAIPRKYTFIAASGDWTVPNHSSTLMKVPRRIPATYGFAYGHSHSSAVAASAQLISEIAIP